MRSIILTFAILSLPVLLSAQWMQVGEDIDGLEHAFLGTDIALSANGKILAVGSPHYGSGDTSGQVRVFVESVGQWIEEVRLVNTSDSMNFFGKSVSISADGRRIGIGASAFEYNQIHGGFVEVYQKFNDTWTQVGQRINGDYPTASFGNATEVSADGKRIAIGAFDYGTSEGLIRIYEEINGQWVQVGQDIYSDPYQYELGYSLSISSDGKRIATGSPKGGQKGGYTGYAKVFQERNGIWTQVGEDLHGHTEENEEFGYSVSLSADGKRLAVGDWKADDGAPNAGEVQIYEELEGQWQQIGSDIVGEAPEDHTGYSVSLSPNGQRLAVGAIKNDDNGENAGQIRIFEEQNGSWNQLGADIVGEAEGDHFGWSVSMSEEGERVAVGTPCSAENGPYSGHASVFKSSPVAVEETNRSKECNIRPNPTSGPFSLDLGDRYSSIDLTLRSTTGEQLGKYQYENRQIIALNIDGPAGVYLLDLLLDEEYREAVKVVKK